MSDEKKVYTGELCRTARWLIQYAVHEIESGFVWADTPQGYEYWQEVVANLKAIAKS